MLSNILLKLKKQENLNKAEAFELQRHILQGKLSDIQILEVFENFDKRNPEKYKNSLKITKEEFTGFVEASRKETIKIDTNLQTIDIVGTGGDNLNTFNISTATALLASKIGLKIAKHGNRSASSISGSADVLEALGYNLEKDEKEILEDLESKNFAFLYAKKYNPAFRFPGPARKMFGKKTYFNFLGPLLNPIQPSYMLLGISDWSMVDLMGQELIKNGLKKLWIVSSKSGMDEIAITENTKVKEFENNEESKEFEISPQDLGFSKVSLEELQIKTREEAKQVLENVLKLKGTEAQNNAVLINLYAVLLISGKAKSLTEAKELFENKMTKLL
jgi:anthranilate phosphoribosyltransferase